MSKTKPPQIARDQMYRRCLHLACKVKSGDMRFGSVLVRDGEVIGEGWNHKKRVPGDPLYPDGPILMGYSIHAEVAAMNQALVTGKDVEGADVYVAGFFGKDGRLYLPRTAHFSCHICPSHFRTYRVRGVHIPMQTGWTFLTTDQAVEIGRQYHRDRLAGTISRAEIGRHPLTVSDLAV